MNNKIVALFIIVAVSTFACHEKPAGNQSLQNLFDAEFQETKSEFPSCMTNHFPRKFEAESTYIFSGSSITEIPSHLVMIRYSVDVGELDSIILFAESQKCNSSLELGDLKKLAISPKYEANTYSKVFLQKILLGADTSLICEIPDSVINIHGFSGHTLNGAAHYILREESASSESFKKYYATYAYPFNRFTKGIIVKRNENLVVYWTVAW